MSWGLPGLRKAEHSWHEDYDLNLECLEGCDLLGAAQTECNKGRYPKIDGKWLYLVNKLSRCSLVVLNSHFLLIHIIYCLFNSIK